VETPFIELGQVSTALYFSYFAIIVPAVSLIENTFTDVSNDGFVDNRFECASRTKQF
jgi:hypothetical protein